MSQPLSREIEIEPAHTALLLVDVQNYNCTWGGGEYAHLDAAQKERRYGYFFRTLKASALPNMVLLQQACRRARIEVTYTIIESLTADGRDRCRLRDQMGSRAHLRLGSLRLQGPDLLGGLPEYLRSGQQ
jgi:nicotinamidase-related amidase